MKSILTPELTLIGRVKNVALGFVISLLWMTYVNVLLNYLFTLINPPLTYPAIQTASQFAHPRLIEFFFACILAPLWEEAAFRVAPLSIARLAGKQFIFPTLLLSSAWFGWMHGDGATSILMQGVMGFIMGCVYVKNNFSYWSSVTLHFLWNFFLLFIAPIFV